ncbi:MAG: hypothetical protein ACREIA_04270 [Opitutaceae bacterium]
MQPNRTDRIRSVHLYQWLWEPLLEDPTFELRAMFGSKAAYLGGRLVLCFTAKEEPWLGVLVCTENAHHDSLMRDLPGLSPHPVLSKWLYLSDAFPGFETTAQKLVERVRQRDPRIGVESGSKRKRRR